MLIVKKVLWRFSIKYISLKDYAVYMPDGLNIIDF